ncbi:MAG: hypothetical protein ACE5Q6_02990 [Dehalococcoidia bacterium]
MSTMIDGESYLGKVLIRPLSKSGDVRLFLWPLRCLKSKMGGPTFGLDVNGEEIIRYDPHGPRGHWHKNGYDKLGAGGSHVDFPEGMVEIERQLSWALEQLQEQMGSLLEEAGHPDAAASLDAELVGATAEAIKAHLEQEGDQRSKAIELGLIDPKM